MELIAVLRLLWRRRVLVVLGVVLAGSITFAFAPGATPSHGFAQTRVMLDTAQSQFAAEAPFGADTLTWRATLAAQTLGTDANRQVIAANAGIPESRLDVTDIELATPLIPASLPRAAVEAAYSTAKPFSIDLHTDDSVPLITISANAPDRASAVRLLNAAVTALEKYTSVPADSERLALDVRTVTPVGSVTMAGGRGRKKMVAFAATLICMWIAGLALMPGLVSTARSALSDQEPAGARS